MQTKLYQCAVWLINLCALAMANTVLAFSGVKDRSTINMTEGVTPVSAEIFKLHMDIFWWCVGIGVVVFGVMFYSMIVHRKSKGAKAANFHESTTLEIVWTVIPFIILIIMAVPATKTLIDIYDVSEADVDIQITGYQWYWKYEYLDQGVQFDSYLSTPKEEIRNQAAKNPNYLLEVDEPLVIPTNKKIRFLVTANDVIHSWWVPDLAVKRDAIPGYNREAWAKVEKPGIYRGVCAELCGKDHGFMPIVVKALPENEYNSWLSGRREQAEKIKALTSKEFKLDELVAIGQKLYATKCSTCHGVNGEGGVGKPIKGSPIATGDINQHLRIVINGQGAMPKFDGLSEVDTASIITYQRNAFGNNTGDVVQPIDVLNYKNAN